MTIYFRNLQQKTKMDQVRSKDAVERVDAGPVSLSETEQDDKIDFRNDSFPLHEAVENNNKARVLKLINEEGLDVNSKSSDGDTPLLIAVTNNNLDLVRMLLDAGADVNIRNESQESTLHVFFHDGVLRNINILRLLLKVGADPYAKDEGGDTALHMSPLSAEFGSFGILAHAVDTTNENNPSLLEERNHFGETVIHKKIRSASLNEVILLEEMNVNLQTQNNNGQSLLHTAAGAETSHNEVIGFLISHGLDVNAKDRLGRTPLHWAAANLDGKLLLDRAELLLENGANPDELDNSGEKQLELYLKKEKRDDDKVRDEIIGVFKK